ncbi:MAG: hypothetical protein GF309_13290 [Candidatus Lokiarchaeota archaeon]|nr:hypothetical protein [Candidatus Lokiarchaeota archaeon]
MKSFEGNHREAFERTILGTVVSGVILGLMIGFVFMLFVPRNPMDTVVMEHGSEYRGNTSHTVEYYSDSGAMSTNILEITEFIDNGEVELKGRGEYIKIDDIEGTTTISGFGLKLAIETYLSVLVYEYEEVVFTLDISVTSGTPDVRLTADSSLDSGIWFFEEYTLDKGDHVLALEMEMDGIRSDADSLIWDTKLGVGIKLEDPGEVEIRRLACEVSSNRTLYPLTIEFNDQKGYDIYDNAFSDNLGYYPFVNISGDSLIHPPEKESACLKGAFNNGIIYLPEGQYSFEYGWGPISDPSMVGVLSAQLQDNQGARILVGYETARLRIDAPKSVPIDLSILDPQISLEDGSWFGIMSEDTSFIYFPPNKSAEIYVKLSNTMDMYAQSVELQFNDTQDIILHVNFPILQNLLFGLDVSYFLVIVVVVGTTLALVVNLHKLIDSQPLTTILNNSEFYALILLILSIFLPWSYHREMILRGGNVIVEYFAFNLPTGLVVENRNNQPLFIRPEEGLNSQLTLWVLLLCILVIAVRVLKPSSISSMVKQLAPYIAAAIIGLWYFFIPVVSYDELSIGPLLPLMALAIMAISLFGGSKITQNQHEARDE